MLKSNYDVGLTPFDLVVFESFVPADHYLRKLKAVIDFTLVRPLVTDCYSPNHGRGAIEPVFLFKLALLQFHYDLSDEQVIRQAQVNMAFRFFLDLSSQAALPEPSRLSQFRTRRGVKRFNKAFQEILRQARGKGLVKDRLRLTDATQLFANIAVPATVRLVAQTREQLLAAAESFAPEEVAKYRQAARDIRPTTSALKDDARLLARVEQLRALIEWGEAWQALLEVGAPPVILEVYEAFEFSLTAARKVLGDRKPKSKDKIISLTDTAARRSQHGEFYDGYLLDVRIDADADLSCGIDVLAANAAAAAKAKNLIESEAAAHGNNIESLSIDAIGFNGPVLKALSADAAGPPREVFVPPKPDWSATPHLYQPDDFKRNEKGDELSCPNGETTKTRYRDGKKHGWVYHFKSSQCANCPLRNKCIAANKQTHRKVSKNDFQSQYKAAKQRAPTEAYKQVRKQHPGIERKLNELLRWHAGRHVRYRGRLRVKVQYLRLGIVVNCKRIVRLLTAAPQTQPA